VTKSETRMGWVRYTVFMTLPLIAQDPDITLFELRDALADATGLQVQHSAIGHLLKRLGFTHKKSHWSPPSAATPR